MQPPSPLVIAQTTLTNITPLSADITAPVRPFVPDALHAPLFGPIAGLHDAHSFAIIDGAKITYLPELLAANALPHASLLPRAEIDINGAAGPWLVDLNKTSDLLRALFTADAPMTGYWEKNAALFIRTTASFAATRDHFAQLVKMPDEAGKQIYFRFWDPKIARDYLPQTENWPARARSLLAPPPLGPLVLSALDIDAQEFHSFRFTDTAPDCAPAPFILTKFDTDVLADREAGILTTQLADWLLEADPHRFRSFGAKGRHALAEHVVASGKILEFVFKEEYVYLAFMMMYLGGKFGRDPLYTDLTKVLMPPRPARYVEMSLGFAPAMSQIFGEDGSMEVLYPPLTKAIGQYINRAGGWDHLTVDHIAALQTGLEHRLNLPDQQKAAAHADAAALCDTLGVTGDKARATLTFLRFLLGVECHADPMHPWLKDTLHASQDIDSNVMKAAKMGYKRLQSWVARNG